jgi:hypothetical protein
MLCHVNGFGHYGDSYLDLKLPKSGTGQSANILSADPWYPGQSYMRFNRTASGNYWDLGAPQGLPLSYYYQVGMAIRLGAGSEFLVSFSYGHRSTGAYHVDFAISPEQDGKIRVYRGGGTNVANSAAGVVPLEAWCYLELRSFMNSSTGYVTAHVNGAQVLSATGINTKSGSGNEAQYVGLRGPYDGSTWTDIGALYVDAGSDFAWRASDSNGLIVDTALVGGAGNSAQFTPSPGPSNYLNVDEALLDALTSYNSSATADQIDRFTLASVPSRPTSSILAVQAWCAGLQQAGGTARVRSLLTYDGSDYEGPSAPLGLATWLASQVSLAAETAPLTRDKLLAAAIGCKSKAS